VARSQTPRSNKFCALRRAAYAARVSPSCLQVPAEAHQWGHSIIFKLGLYITKPGHSIVQSLTLLWHLSPVAGLPAEAHQWREAKHGIAMLRQPRLGHRVTAGSRQQQQQAGYISGCAAFLLIGQCSRSPAARWLQCCTLQCCSCLPDAMHS
jgi:hypothetical protein